MSKPRQIWDRHAILAEVRRRGMTLTGIARDAGLDPSACRHGIGGNNRKGAQAIADALGIPFRTLFPDQYKRGHNSEANLSLKNRTASSPKSRSQRDDQVVA